MLEVSRSVRGARIPAVAHGVGVGLMTISAGLLVAGCAAQPRAALPQVTHVGPHAAGRHSHRGRPLAATVTRLGGGSSGTAEEALASLLARAKGRAPLTGYRRAAFGPAWTDDTAAPWGHDGCDTRDEILRRDLTHVVLGSDGCTVESGVLHDPYTGKVIRFTRGVTTSAAVQIDHVASLGDDWQTGAQRLSYARREALANDPLNLLAVDGPTNEAKGDGDAAAWLPPNRAFRCAYVARQLAVKVKYRLWVTPAEGAAMRRVLARCATETLPAEGDALRRTDGRELAAPAPRGSTVPSPRPASANGGVFYPDCAAARAAGAAPLHRGQPGYRPGLDGDGDGIACE